MVSQFSHGDDRAMQHDLVNNENTNSSNNSDAAGCEPRWRHPTSWNCLNPPVSLPDADGRWQPPGSEPSAQVLQPLGVNSTYTPQFESALPMPTTMDPSQLLVPPAPLSPYVRSAAMPNMVDPMQLQQDMNNMSNMNNNMGSMNMNLMMQQMQDPGFPSYDFQCGNFMPNPQMNTQMNPQMNFMMPTNGFQCPPQMNNNCFESFDQCGGAMGYAPGPSTMMPLPPLAPQANMQWTITGSQVGNNSAPLPNGVRLTRLVPCTGPSLEDPPIHKMPFRPIPDTRCKISIAWMTTADCANRERDKKRVEGCLNLPEVGDLYTAFLDSAGFQVALGYDRVVYGDHGPYLELSHHQVLLLNKSL